MRCAMKVNIKTLFKTIEIDIDIAQTVGELRSIIEDKTGIFPQDQQLYYKGTLLQGDDTLLSAHSINPNRTCVVYLRVFRNSATFHNAIQQRAYYIWKETGCEENRANDHWVQAESEFFAGEYY